MVAAPQILKPDTTGKYGFSDGDVAYINRGERDGSSGGDEFMVVRTSATVLPPGGRVGDRR